ncbi:MAG: hypothetical protein AAF702_11015 [Chloroflexota bacterium]
MPNLILEYSDNVEFDSKSFFRQLHESLVETGAFNLKGLKSRAVQVSDYYIADGNPEYKFVHLNIVLREGRSRAVREEIAQRAMVLLEATFGHYREGGHINLSTDMNELEVGLALTNHNIPSRPRPQQIHLVGSVPLPTASDVFEQICGAVGPYLTRLPDGETGERSRWISFQRAMLEEHPAIMVNPAGRTFTIRDLEGKVSREDALLVLNPTFPVDEIEFRPLGYSHAAIESWKLFQQKQRAGIIPTDLRFQVSLPTPFATGLHYFHPDAHESYIELMQDALLQEVTEICAAIPHKHLAIQWDCCQEILLIEGYYPDDWRYDAGKMAPVVAALGNALPDDVELGFHFCYGSPVDSPLVKQRDMGVVVDFCNQIAANLTHSLDFAHMPVSVPDADADFFSPLKDLTISGEAQIYLGILHPKVPGGDMARIQKAQQSLPSFGVATECGWGRKSTETVDKLLQVHLNAVSG